MKRQAVLDEAKRVVDKAYELVEEIKHQEIEGVPLLDVACHYLENITIPFFKEPTSVLDMGPRQSIKEFIWTWRLIDDTEKLLKEAKDDDQR